MLLLSRSFTSQSPFLRYGGTLLHVDERLRGAPALRCDATCRPYVRALSPKDAPGVIFVTSSSRSSTANSIKFLSPASVLTARPRVRAQAICRRWRKHIRTSGLLAVPGRWHIVPCSYFRSSCASAALHQIVFLHQCELLCFSRPPVSFDCLHNAIAYHAGVSGSQHKYSQRHVHFKSSSR